MPIFKFDEINQKQNNLIHNAFASDSLDQITIKLSLFGAKNRAHLKKKKERHH